MVLRSPGSAHAVKLALLAGAAGHKLKYIASSRGMNDVLRKLIQGRRRLMYTFTKS